MGLDAEGKVSYSVVASNGIRISVVSFIDLLNGSFDELAHFGKYQVARKRRLGLNRSRQGSTGPND